MRAATCDVDCFSQIRTGMVYGMVWGVRGNRMLGGGNSKIFGIFTPKLGEDEPIFDEHILQLGWFNHQLCQRHDNLSLFICRITCHAFLLQVKPTLPETNHFLPFENGPKTRKGMKRWDFIFQHIVFSEVKMLVSGRVCALLFCIVLIWIWIARLIAITRPLHRCIANLQCPQVTSSQHLHRIHLPHTTNFTLKGSKLGRLST